jgi:hypothetical protein
MRTKSTAKDNAARREMAAWLESDMPRSIEICNTTKEPDQKWEICARFLGNTSGLVANGLTLAEAWQKLTQNKSFPLW